MGAHGVLESIEAPELHREALLGLDREKVGSQIIPELRVSVSATLLMDSWDNPAVL